MRRIMSLLIAAIAVASPRAIAQSTPASSATSSGSFKARLQVRVDRPGATIDPNIYGTFAEHLGRGIYEGVWVGENSPIPNTRGIRNDVVAALRKIKLPILRWPGGCFADEYHWRDGIGPRAKRPHRANTSWGGVETNAFGVHEFMDFAELVGAAPYISINVGSGSPREMMEWLEYMTSDSDSSLARLRRDNGRQQPWSVKFVGIGNEAWGCGGNMRPEYYADEYKRYAAFVKRYGAEEFVKIAVGPSDEDYNWTEVVMREATKHIDGLSLHYYTLPTGDWKAKGSATQFGEPEWRATLRRTLRMDEFIEKHSAIMDKYDPDKRVALIVDEWGTWYESQPGKGALYQQNTLRDALVAAINLNVFNQHAERVRMAASAQAINVLQALLLTNQGQLVLTPTYHVFDMYQVHQGATSIPIELQGPRYGVGADSVPAVHASASRDRDGVLHLSLVNLDPSRTGDITVSLKGEAVRTVTGRVLTAQAMNALNDFGSTAVEPTALTAKVANGGVTLSLPSKSVVVLAVR